jgi:hypothetical protein
VSPRTAQGAFHRGLEGSDLSSLHGEDLTSTGQKAEVLHLVPGRYSVRAWCLRSDRLTLVLRQVIRMGSA